MNQITDQIKIDDSECDVNCGLKAYANLVGLVNKNSEIVQKVSGKHWLFVRSSSYPMRKDNTLKKNSLYNLYSLILHLLQVFSRLGPDLNFLTNTTTADENLPILPPKVITTCRSGFGIEKSKSKICGKVLIKISIELYVTLENGECTINKK